MTDQQLTALSTIAWIIGTGTAFILLAHWSAGGSWGISSAITRGLTGWTGRSFSMARERPGDEDLAPIRPPRLDRLWAAKADSTIGSAPPGDLPMAEIEDLGTRRLR